MSSHLKSLVGNSVFVITNDGKTYVGFLRGVDQTTNIILEECYERICTTDEGIKQILEGLKIIRGDNIAVIAEIDEAVDSAMDLKSIQAQPLKPVVH